MSEQIRHVTDGDFEEVVLNFELPVLVDFWADWCAPCHLVAPVVEQLAREETGRTSVAKLNIDDNPNTAQRFGVMSIPTLILFGGGEEKGRVIGARSKDSIRQALLGDVAA